MVPMTYPATIEEAAPGEFLVTFVDIPEAITGGATYEEALGEAADALAVAIEGLIGRGDDLPAPRPARAGEIDVPLDPAIAARLLLVSEMAREGLSKIGLARRMGQDEKTVRRILSGKGASFALTLSALRAVGVRPALSRPVRAKLAS